MKRDRLWISTLGYWGEGGSEVRHGGGGDGGGAHLAPDEAREVEELGARVDFLPEALLEALLGGAQGLVVLELVHVGEDAHDFGEAVDLQHVQELKGLHFEPETGVDEEQHEVGNLRKVDHGGQGVGALEEGEAALLARHHRHGAAHIHKTVPAEFFHQRLRPRRVRARFGRGRVGTLRGP